MGTNSVPAVFLVSVWQCPRLWKPWFFWSRVWTEENRLRGDDVKISTFYDFFFIKIEGWDQRKMGCVLAEGQGEPCRSLNKELLGRGQSLPKGPKEEILLQGAGGREGWWNTLSRDWGRGWERCGLRADGPQLAGGRQVECVLTII